MDLRTRSGATNELVDALTRPAPPPALPLPEQFKVVETPGRLDVRWRWFAPVHLFLLVFALFWNGFMVMWFSIALAQGITAMALFGSFHAIIGIGVGYGALAGLINSTRISLEGGLLSVRHGPLPWVGAGDWKKEDLAQLYGEQRVISGKNGRRTTFSLNAMLRDGRRVTLVKGLTDKTQALWLERALETRLQIVDAPVRGELDKR